MSRYICAPVIRRHGPAGSDFLTVGEKKVGVMLSLIRQGMWQVGRVLREVSLASYRQRWLQLLLQPRSHAAAIHKCALLHSPTLIAFTSVRILPRLALVEVLHAVRIFL